MRRFAISCTFPKASINGKTHLAAANPQNIKMVVTMRSLTVPILSRLRNGRNHKNAKTPAKDNNNNNEWSLKKDISIIILPHKGCQLPFLYQNTASAVSVLIFGEETVMLSNFLPYGSGWTAVQPASLSHSTPHASAAALPSAWIASAITVICTPSATSLGSSTGAVDTISPSYLTTPFQ